MAQTHRTGALKQTMRGAGKPRDFLKIIRNRPRIRGVAYYPPPLHVGPVFAEIRQIPGNQSEWRRPTVKGDMAQFLGVVGAPRDFLKILRGRPRMRDVAYFARRATQESFPRIPIGPEKPD